MVLVTVPHPYRQVEMDFVVLIRSVCCPWGIVGGPRVPCVALGSAVGSVEVFLPVGEGESRGCTSCVVTLLWGLRPGELEVYQSLDSKGHWPPAICFIDTTSDMEYLSHFRLVSVYWLCLYGLFLWCGPDVEGRGGEGGEG